MKEAELDRVIIDGGDNKRVRVYGDKYHNFEYLMVRHKSKQ